MTPRLVIATNNRGKLREYADLLDGCGFELVTPRDLGLDFGPEETGSTYEDNATIKAAEAGHISGLIALGDDSGIEVDALDGRPGLYSARYAGPGLFSDEIAEEEQVRLLLAELSGVAEDRRTARFVCAIAIVAPGAEARIVRAEWAGTIAREARGEHGFGYDPVFIPAAIEDNAGITSAELTPDVKNRISHRGQAAAKALDVLKELSRDTRST